MKTNLNFKKIKAFKTKQDYLRKKAIKSGVNLIAPETIFLSNDTRFGKNVIINPYVVIGKKVKIGNRVEILSFTHIEGAKIENNVKIDEILDINVHSGFLKYFVNIIKVIYTDITKFIMSISKNKKNIQNYMNCNKALILIIILVLINNL